MTTETTPITLTTTVGEVQVILSALSKLPFGEVADLWFKVKHNAELQLAQAQEAGKQGDLLAESAGGTD